MNSAFMGSKKKKLKVTAITTGSCSLVVPGTICIYELRGSIPHNYIPKKKKKATAIEKGENIEIGVGA